MCARQIGYLLTFRHSDGMPLSFCALHSRERYARTRQQLVAGDPICHDNAAAGEDDGKLEAQRLRNIERNRRQLAALTKGVCL